MSEQTQSPFWRFSLALYRQDGVPPACITLQDQSGVDVNVMLYGLWLAAQGRALSAADMAAIDSAVGTWRADVVVPLRSVRRVLKEPAAVFNTPDTQALREKIKAVELESERLQQEALHALKAPQEWGRASLDMRGTAAANMRAYEQALGVRFDDGAQSAMLAGLKALAGTGKIDAVGLLAEQASGN